MNTKTLFFKLFFKPLTRWVARRALIGRNRSQHVPEKGRFTQVDVNRLLDQSWQAFGELVPDVSSEPTFGSRLNVRLAALTLAFHQSLISAGVERNYANELVADTCWVIYQYWGNAGLLANSLSLNQDPAKHVRKDGIWPITFPFNYPGYIARYVPGKKGVAFDVLRCPVAEYFREHSEGDIAVKTWCMLDYGIAEIVGKKLVRTQTLAAGDDRCDFRWLPTTKG